MNATELKELAATLVGIADGKAWQWKDGSTDSWRDSDPGMDPMFWGRKPRAIRLKPWTLSRHIPGFRPLLESEQWHREDWKEEWLPAGWRPLLLWPARDDGDYSASVDGLAWNDYDVGSGCPKEAVDAPWAFWRTRRPLPEPDKWAKEKAAHAAGKCVQWRSDISRDWRDLEPGGVIWSYGEFRIKPEPEYAPLEPSDFPPGAAIRHPAWDKGEWYLPHTCGPNAQQWRRDNMPTLFMPPMDGRTLMNEGWLYLLPGQSDWQPCRKIAPEKP